MKQRKMKGNTKMQKQKSFKTIGAYFKAAREKSDLTQEFVANALGYTSKQIISNWERGLCAPPLEQLEVIIKLFKLDKKEVIDLFVDQYELNLKNIVKFKG